MELIDHK